MADPVGPAPRPLAERLRAQWQVVLADECVAANVGCYEAEQLSLVIEEAADLIERQAKVVEAARLLNSFPTINLDEYEQINAFDSVTDALSAFDDREAERAKATRLGWGSVWCWVCGFTVRTEAQK